MVLALLNESHLQFLFPRSRASLGEASVPLELETVPSLGGRPGPEEEEGRELLPGAYPSLRASFPEGLGGAWNFLPRLVISRTTRSPSLVLLGKEPLVCLLVKCGPNRQGHSCPET